MSANMLECFDACYGTKQKKLQNCKSYVNLAPPREILGTMLEVLILQILINLKIVGTRSYLIFRV